MAARTGVEDMVGKGPSVLAQQLLLQREGSCVFLQVTLSHVTQTVFQNQCHLQAVQGGAGCPCSPLWGLLMQLSWLLVTEYTART